MLPAGDRPCGPMRGTRPAKGTVRDTNRLSRKSSFYGSGNRAAQRVTSVRKGLDLLLLCIQAKKRGMVSEPPDRPPCTSGQPTTFTPQQKKKDKGVPALRELPFIAPDISIYPRRPSGQLLLHPRKSPHKPTAQKTPINTNSSLRETPASPISGSAPYAPDSAHCRSP